MRHLFNNFWHAIKPIRDAVQERAISGVADWVRRKVEKSKR